MLKKFEQRRNSNKIWSHLELYGPDILTDCEDDEEQESKVGLLGADANAHDLEEGIAKPVLRD